MSRFYFHLTSTRDVPDHEGVELATLLDARCYAVKMIAEVLRTSPERYWEAEVYRVTVTEHRSAVETRRFRKVKVGTEAQARAAA